MLLRLLHRLQPIVLILAFAAVVVVLVQQWPSLRDYPWRLHIGWLLAAVVFTLSAWLIEIWLWTRTLYLLGSHRLRLLPAIRIWFLSAVVRYIPGNIWQPLSLTVYAHRRGIPPEVTIASIVVFQGLILIAVLPITAAFVFLDDTQSILAQFMGPTTSYVLAAFLLGVVALLLQPDWFMRLTNFALHKMGRRPLNATLDRGAFLWLTLATVVHWLIWGAAFAAFTFAFVGAGIADRSDVVLYLVGSYAIAYAIGFLSFITPSGFGVREGAFFLLLVPRIDGAVVTVIALGMRVWTTVGELLFALLSAPIERGQSARPVPQPPETPTVASTGASPDPTVAADLRREAT